MKTETDSPVARTLLYHEQTKHHLNRYARSAGFLDWANQPNPFRFYEGAEALRLPLLKEGPASEHAVLYLRNGNTFREFSRESVGAFLELSLGLSAWKSASGNSWALRINPSSGNLHPTEAYLILPELPGIAAGVFHYSPYLHALELRASVSEMLCQHIKDHFHTDGFLIALTSIFWREAWKYGERAFRYCQHDAGHALAALSFSANLLGWKVTWLGGVADDEIAKVLGFDKTGWPELEGEHPELLCFVHSGGEPWIPQDLPIEIGAEFSRLNFHGAPNRLSEDHVDWEIIPRVAEATSKPGGCRIDSPQGPSGEPKGRPIIPAAQLIRQRRSAVAFDGVTSLTRDQFYTILDKTLPRANCAPFDLGLSPPCVHLLLFVHRVTGLEPGLYFLLRTEKDLHALRQKGHRRFLWRLAAEDMPPPARLPLYLLELGDFQSTATSVSCGQAIAGDGAFSLGMIARFRPEIEAAAYRYRHLFWETGIIGQVLYLEAEAQGVRGTGIGCFFDDSVHALMGFSDDTFQSLYHFTIGGALEDNRLATRPAYHHLKTAKD